MQIGNYKVHISDDLRQLASVISRFEFSQAFILVDDNTLECCLPLLMKSVTALKRSVIFQIPDGERNKNIGTCIKLWQELLEKGADREALLINLGGGVIGDMGGFVASTYKRGIPFINVPTTLLSQVDATVGGKLGVDFMNAKNVIGLFNNPQAVFIHPAFLKTLPDDELLSGFAEMIKHALISSADLWDEIKQINPFKTKSWAQLIHRSLLVKKKIVESDPYEKGVRRTLNFGHTIGHAFESAALEAGIKLLHGHAVAIGIIVESYLSVKLLRLPEKHLHDITDFILKYYRQYFDSEISDINWKGWIKHDKKNAYGRLNFTLLKSIGKPAINLDCDFQQIVEAAGFLKSRL